MAVPRVFISSTYYDLKEVRNNLGNFVMNLGYEPIMHERASVAYTQEKPLEDDCYHELASCDIAVCVIGSKFGSQSSNNDLSITMNEIEGAIKLRKKVYIFIVSSPVVSWVRERDDGLRGERRDLFFSSGSTAQSVWKSGDMGACRYDVDTFLVVVGK